MLVCAVVAEHSAGLDGSVMDAEAAQGRGWCRGDAARLGRVVQNLIDNAVKYRPPGSPVRVEVRAAVDDQAGGHHPACIA